MYTENRVLCAGYLGNIDIIDMHSVQNCLTFERISSDAMSEVTVVWKLILRVNDGRQKLLKLFVVLTIFLFVFFIRLDSVTMMMPRQLTRSVLLFKIVSPAFRNFRCTPEQCFIRMTKTEFRKTVSTQYKYNLFLGSNNIRRRERGHKYTESRGLITISASSTNGSRGIS